MRNNWERGRRGLVREAKDGRWWDRTDEKLMPKRIRISTVPLLIACKKSPLLVSTFDRCCVSSSTNISTFGVI
ncbi:Uncharacterized protein TCM_004648 [Theobroma cacao]|uniref:Uncharacterized protein n=1 Tax=Theobroma cacao TaxID=3641 RepID=A0A061DQH7_THECC|nr:Uncharacterized protein TCM_004648 [Theobroma cacao]